MLENYLISHIKYDPETGEVSSDLGSVTFNTIRPNGKSYIRINIFGFRILAHRAAWFLFHKKWPSHEIDHLNGNGSDNRIDNLRDVPSSENQKNRRLSKNNKTGVSGVYVVKNKYRAQIKVSRKKIFLGTYGNLFDAACARKSAERLHGFHENHGTVRPL